MWACHTDTGTCRQRPFCVGFLLLVHDQLPLFDLSTPFELTPIYFFTSWTFDSFYDDDHHDHMITAPTLLTLRFLTLLVLLAPINPHSHSHRQHECGLYHLCSWWCTLGPQLIGLSAAVYGPSRAAKASALGLNYNSLGGWAQYTSTSTVRRLGQQIQKILTSFFCFFQKSISVRLGYRTACSTFLIKSYVRLRESCPVILQ